MEEKKEKNRKVSINIDLEVKINGKTQEQFTQELQEVIKAIENLNKKSSE